MAVSMDDAAAIMWGCETTTQERHAWGTVVSANADGTLEVALNASGTATTCAKTCQANKGDRVLVLIMQTGAVVIGKRC